MKMAYGYARVSTYRQTKGYSIEYQKERTFQKFETDFSDTHIWGDVYVDNGVSASKKQVLQRPTGLLLHQQLKEGDVLIVTRIARICRSLSDFLFMLRYWEERGISFICSDDPVDTSDKSPFGRFFLQMIGSLAELESAMLSERILEANASRIKDGVQSNGHPILHEWRKDGKLYPFEPERTAAEMFYKMRADGLSREEIYLWCESHRYFGQPKFSRKPRKKKLTSYFPNKISNLTEMHRRYLWLSKRGVDVFGREYLDATARRETPMTKGGVMPQEMFNDPLTPHQAEIACRVADE